VHPNLYEFTDFTHVCLCVWQASQQWKKVFFQKIYILKQMQGLKKKITEGCSIATLLQFPGITLVENLRKTIYISLRRLTMHDYKKAASLTQRENSRSKKKVILLSKLKQSILCINWNRKQVPYQAEGSQPLLVFINHVYLRWY